MLRKFIRRFERLEHIPKDSLYKECLKISKRFERLEIGERKIEVAITDRIAQAETAPAYIPYSIVCPFCGRENLCSAKFCVSCQRSLETRLVENFQKAAHSIKKCVCGAVNQAQRRDCWICGRDFTLAGDKNAAIDSENEIAINIDGARYRSSDKNLPLEIVMLMERIRRYGYSKELVDDWVKRKKAEDDSRQESLRGRIEEVRSRLSLRQIQLILGAIGLFVYIVISLIFRG